MAKSPFCFTCGSDAHYQGVFGDMSPRGVWSKGQFCYYCKAVVDQFTLGHIMWTRLVSRETEREASAAIAAADRLFKKANKKGIKKK